MSKKVTYMSKKIWNKWNQILKDKSFNYLFLPSIATYGFDPRSGLFFCLIFLCLYSRQLNQEKNKTQIFVRRDELKKMFKRSDIYSCNDFVEYANINSYLGKNRGDSSSQDCLIYHLIFALVTCRHMWNLDM